MVLSPGGGGGADRAKKVIFINGVKNDSDSQGKEGFLKLSKRNLCQVLGIFFFEGGGGNGEIQENQKID
jgi:hypothetical protein